jgi:hypothetical protein
LRSENNVIQVDGNTVEGIVAQGAVAEYRVMVEASSPIRLNFSASGDHGTYKIEIFDSTGKAFYLDPYKRYSGTETFSIPFTAWKSDTFSLRIIGTEGESRYALNIKRATK